MMHGQSDPFEREQLENVFSVIPGGLASRTSYLWLWDLPSGMLYFSCAGFLLRRFSEKEGTWQKLVHPGDRKEFNRRFADMLVSGQNASPPGFLHRLKMDSGKYQWVLSQFRVMDRDGEGKATRIVAASFDVVALSSDREIRENAVRMHHALDATKSGLWDWDVLTGKAWFSSQYALMAGLPLAPFFSEMSSWISRIHRDDIKETLKLLYAHVDSSQFGDVCESACRFRLADGRYEWVLVRAKIVERNDDGRAVRVICLQAFAGEQYEAPDALINMVNTDQLTRLSSRWAFDTELSSLTEADYPVSLIYVDMDGLKLINDNLGHEAGDRQLVIAADIIRRAFRARDVVARVGGDEFVVLLPHCPVAVASRLARHIRSSCRKYNANADHLPIFLSVGVAGTEQGIELFHLYAEADKNMIRRKRRDAGKHYRVLGQWMDRHADLCLVKARA